MLPFLVIVDGITDITLTDTAAYILAILDVPGAGTATAFRLAPHFPSPQALASCPLEQIIVRLKRVPNASTLAQDLRSQIEDRYDERKRYVDQLQRKGVSLLSLLDADWPHGLRQLPADVRPLVLFLYGSPRALALPRISFHANPPLNEEAFDFSQKALKRVVQSGGAPVVGARTGFDVAATKICSIGDLRGHIVMVASSGLAKLESTFRPAATAAVRAGGLLLSPFEMNHGPFEHDDRSRTMIQAALADATVFVDPQGEGPEQHALHWATENQRPVFQIGGDPIDKLHFLVGDGDLDWLVVASGIDPGPPDLTSGQLDLDGATGDQ